LLEAFPCNSKDELRTREDQLIRATECVNMRIDKRTPVEWRQDNAEKLKQAGKKYYRDNTDKMLAYSKEHYRENIAEVTARCKQYRDNNSEKIKAYKKQYNIDHKGTVTCECSCIVSNLNLSQHRKTKKHLLMIADPSYEGSNLKPIAHNV
jgi:hypothetical protein